MSRLRVYVAGAYSAPNIMGVFSNMRRGMQLGLKVLQAGYAPFTPWFDYHLPLMAELTVEEMYEYSMAWLEASDAVIVVPEGASDSKGTQAELIRARELDIPVYWDIETLIEEFPIC